MASSTSLDAVRLRKPIATQHLVTLATGGVGFGRGRSRDRHNPRLLSRRSRDVWAPPACCETPVSGVEDDLARVVELIAQQPEAAGDRDGVGSLRRLCAAAAQALSASGVAMSVMTEDGVRGATIASDPASERIEELQFVLGEGPSLDAVASHRPVLVPDLVGEAMSRWPAFTPAAGDHGVRAVFALPLQVGAARLGVLDVFRARPGHLSRDELRCALMFAEVALTTLLDGQANADVGALADGLAGAVESRAEIHQAQGMVMVQLGVGLAEALARMRAHAYAEDQDLSDVAGSIIARRLRFDPDHGVRDDGGNAGRQS
jgi:hypothetical protein